MSTVTERLDAIQARADRFNAEFPNNARQDVPALVNALRAVLAVCDRRDAKPVDGARTVPTATIRAAIEEALGD